MRLNLPRHNCVHFGISGELTVSEKDDGAIQSFIARTGTHSHERSEGRGSVALFGSRSRFGDANLRVLGSISRSPGPDEQRSIQLSLTIDRIRDQLRRPPSVFRPVSMLVDAACGLFGTIKLNCDARFEYDRLQRYASKARFPAPLIVQEGSAGITHIDGAQFSRRVSGETEYRISVTVSDDGASFVHSVDFETEVLLDRRAIHRLFERARSISSELLIRAEVG